MNLLQKKMKQRTLFIGLILLAMMAWTKPPLFLNVSLESAGKRAIDENKKILVFLHTEWCGSCKRMAEEIKQNRELSDAILGQFIPIAVDAESSEGKAIMLNHSLKKAYPTVLIVDGNGQKVDCICGWELKEFQSFLQDVSESRNTLPQLLSQYQTNPSDSDTAIRLARKYASQSHHDEAIRCMQKVIKDPKQKNKAENHFLLALYCLNSGQFSSAKISIDDGLAS